MAGTTDNQNDIVEGEEDGGEAKPKAGKKKLLIIAGAGAAVLLLGGGGAAYMLMSGGSEAQESADHGGAHKSHAKAAAKHGGGEGEEGKDAFVDVPPMIVNLRSPDGTARFLKVHIAIVPGEMTGDEIKTQLPVLLDAYQPFLRELRPEDLAGSAAVFRVKEELLVRATNALGEDSIKDILIQDLVQQ